MAMGNLARWRLIRLLGFGLLPVVVLAAIVVAFGGLAMLESWSLTFWRNPLLIVPIAAYVGLVELVIVVAFDDRRSRVSAFVLGILLVVLALGGWAGGVVYWSLMLHRGQIEVVNRTQTLIWVVGSEQSFAVPACGQVTQDNFVLDRFDLYDDRNRFILRTGGRDAFSLLVTSGGPSFLPAPAPGSPLPPCLGAAVGQ
jgi:hypothetical protein